MNPEPSMLSSDSPGHDNGTELGNGSKLNSPVSKVLLPEGKKRNPSYVGDPTTAVDMGNVSTMSMASSNVSPKINVLPASKRNIPRSILSDQDSDVTSEFQLSHNQNGDGDIVDNENLNVEENVDENDGDEVYEDDEEDLHNILNDLIRHEPQTLYTTASQSLAAQNIAPTLSNSNYNASTVLDYNIFPYNESDSELSEDALINRYISVSKKDSDSVFHSKYKQVFVLSSAGKPIYSLNGSDEVIMGYMGLITTIVSTFEETKDHEEIKSITYDDCKIVIMNRSPLILVAITKIGYEKMQLRKAADVETDIDDQSILLRQLDTLYNYLLSMISKPMITKNFHNRMNYDLRKILTPLDFQNLDSIVMKITYGVSIKEPISSEDTRVTAADTGFGVFASELLDSALECVKLTNTTRTKLNSILLSSKKVKIPKTVEDVPSAYQTIADSIPFLKASTSDINGTTSTPAAISYGDDLLFAILLDANCKIMSAMKPKYHNLKNEDLKILLTLISNQQHLTRHVKSEEGILDLWIPICMPHFNCNGFLYAFVKTIFVKSEDAMETPSSSIPITIVLLSSSKNSFFNMQEVSKQIEFRITKKTPTFTSTLYQELSTTTISIFRDIHVPQIKHFIYKLRSSNQFVSSDIDEFSRGESSTTMNILKLVYFYSTLHNTRATPIRNTELSGSGSGGTTGSGASNGISAPAKSTSEGNGSSSTSALTGRNKKLTYIKNFGRNGENIICFMLCSDKYEFYCLCDDRTITTQLLINHSLKIIKWCEKNRKRLFIEAGAVF